MVGPKDYVIYDDDGNLQFHELTPSQKEEFQYHSPCGYYLYTTMRYLLNATYTIDNGVITISGDLHTDKVLGYDNGSISLKSFRLKKGDPLIALMKEYYFIDEPRIEPFKRKRWDWSKFKMVEYIDESMVFIKRGRFVKRESKPQTYKTSNFRVKHHEKEEKKV